MTTRARILIVDDEPYNVDYLDQELEDAGYATLAAFDGEQALDMVQRQKPDLILLDIMMPRLDGYEVLKRLKASPETRDIPVIVISADDDLRSVVMGIRLGAEDYLPKPFEPVLLHARIASSLGRKRLHDLETLHRQGLERELQIAREIQNGFLPATLPVLAGWEIATCFRAARDVAGDYYDAFLLPDGGLVCLLGDVCGKGVGAALFMTLFRTLLRATLTTGVCGAVSIAALPAAERLMQTVMLINSYVSETHGERGIFTTLFVSLLDPETGTMAYVNCGNDPPLLLRAGRVHAELAPTGPVLGILSEAQFAARELYLQPGDLLLAYTDGVTDALDNAGESYGRERLLETVTGRDLAHAGAQALLEDIEVRVCDHIADTAQFDDITLLALARQAPARL